MKKSKKSFGEILRTHPFPGLRIERSESGEQVLHLGRPGLFSRALPLAAGDGEEAIVEPVEETPEIASADSARTEPRQPSEAENLWLQATGIWEQIQVSAFDERPAMEKESLALFTKALELDPTMTDAMLGIHATCPERRDEMTAAMFSSVGRFGETRDRFARRLHSVYFPLMFSAEPLETIDDLLRARAKTLAVAGEIEAARNLLAGAEDCILNDMTAIDILFHEGRHADAIISIQAAQGNPDLTEFTENDLLLLQAISFIREGHVTTAIKMLEEIAKGARLQAAQHFARYELANLAIRENAPDLAREQLETLIAENPEYRDARQRLAALDEYVEQDEFETTSPGRSGNPLFDDIVDAFYSEEVADDPSLPDNQI